MGQRITGYCFQNNRLLFLPIFILFFNFREQQGFREGQKGTAPTHCVPLEESQDMHAASHAMKVFSTAGPCTPETTHGNVRHCFS